MSIPRAHVQGCEERSRGTDRVSEPRRGQMSERDEGTTESTGAERKADQAGDRTGPDDARRRRADATPANGTEGNPGQTQTEPPADDAGGAEDEADRTE